MCVVYQLLYGSGLSIIVCLLKIKICAHYFYQILIFSPNDSPSKTMKNAFYFI